MKPDRLLATALGCVVVVTLLAWALLGGGERGGEAAGPSRASRAAERTLVLDAEGGDGGGVRRALGVGEREPIVGSVAVLEHDRRREDASGTLTFELRWARESRRVDVPFENGRFTLADDADIATAVRVVSAEVDGSRASVWGSDRSVSLSAGTLHVAVNRLLVAPLEVVSRATGESLEDVEVVLAGPDAAAGDRDPGPLGRTSPWVVRGGHSPVDIAAWYEPLRGRASFDAFVRARGHAWSFARIATREPGRIELDPGGDLTLALDGRSDGDHRLELVDDATGDVVLARDVRLPDELRLTGVPAGHYRARVPLPLGTDFDPPLDERTVTVKGGGVARAELHVGDPDEALAEHPIELELNVTGWPKLGRIGATVVQHAPDGRSVQRGRARVELRAAGAGRQVGTASLGAFAPGRYSVRFSALSWVQPFTVDGPTAVTVDVPAPRDVVVSCVDAVDGEPLDGGPLVAWAGPEPVTGDGDGVEQRALGAGVHRVRAAPGELTLELVDPELGPRRTTVPLAADGERLVARFPRASAIRVRFELDGVPWPGRPEPRSVEAEHVDGAGRVDVKLSSPGQLRLWLTEPGAYRLTFRAPAGCARIERRDVEVESGVLTDVVVALERS